MDDEEVDGILISYLFPQPMLHGKCIYGPFCINFDPSLSSQMLQSLLE